MISKWKRKQARGSTIRVLISIPSSKEMVCNKEKYKMSITCCQLSVDTAMPIMAAETTHDTAATQRQKTLQKLDIFWWINCYLAWKSLKPPSQSHRNQVLYHKTVSNSKDLLHHFTKKEISHNEKGIFGSKFWFPIKIVRKIDFLFCLRIYASVPVAILFQNDADSLAYVKKQN